MSQTPRLGTSAIPPIPVTGTTIGYDPTASPPLTGPTVQDAIDQLQVEIDALTPGAPFATPAIVLGTAAAAGSASSVIRSDSTIVAFDATVPTAIGTTAATGSAAVAPRRDHVHNISGALIASLGFTGPLLVNDGITSPPETLWNEDGTDWLYADVSP